MFSNIYVYEYTYMYVITISKKEVVSLKESNEEQMGENRR